MNGARATYCETAWTNARHPRRNAHGPLARIGLVAALTALAAGCSSPSSAPSASGDDADGTPDTSEPGSSAPAGVQRPDEMSGPTPTPGEDTGGVMEGQDPDAIANVQEPAQPMGSPEIDEASGSPVTPSSGCGAAGQPLTGERSIDVNGVTRTYLLDIPAGYDGSTAQPIVFGFHGATTSGEFFRSPFYGNLLSTMADVAIVVHPDALGNPTQWSNTDGADVAFFDALLAALQSELCIDESRVFATGHSSGGFFTNTLGCQRGDVLRAIAPVSAGGPFTFGGNGCTGEVAAWIAHGENDMTVEFAQGESSRDRWLASNGCDETSSPVPPAPCQEYSGCDAGLPVRWCVYQDGHNWPDFAPEGIWSFFSAL